MTYLQADINNSHDYSQILSLYIFKSHAFSLYKTGGKNGKVIKFM